MKRKHYFLKIEYQPGYVSVFGNENGLRLLVSIVNNFTLACSAANKFRVLDMKNEITEGDTGLLLEYDESGNENTNLSIRYLKSATACSSLLPDIPMFRVRGSKPELARLAREIENYLDAPSDYKELVMHGGIDLAEDSQALDVVLDADCTQENERDA